VAVLHEHVALRGRGIIAAAVIGGVLLLSARKLGSHGAPDQAGREQRDGPDGPSISCTLQTRLGAKDKLMDI
jgi:hypothetical protein